MKLINPSSQEPVLLWEYDLEIPVKQEVKRSGFFARKPSQVTDWPVVNISLEFNSGRGRNLLEFLPGAVLLETDVTDGKAPEFRGVELQDGKCRLKVFLQPNRISKYSGTEARKKISVTLLLDQGEGYDAWDQMDPELNLLPVEGKPVFEFELASASEAGIQVQKRNNTWRVVGEGSISSFHKDWEWHKINSPEIRLEVNREYQNNFRLVWQGISDQFTSGIPHHLVSAENLPSGAELRFLLQFCEQGLPESFADTPAEIVIVGSSKTTEEGNTITLGCGPVAITLRLLPNIVRPELKASYVSGGENQQDALISGQPTKSRQYSWQKTQPEMTSTWFEIHLENLGKEGQGWVEILAMSMEITDETPGVGKPELTFYINGQAVGTSSGVKWNVSEVRELRESFQLKVAISYQCHDPLDIPAGRYRAGFSCTYRLQGLDGAANPSILSNIFMLEMAENHGSHWLAVDFGTSSIVAAFADTQNEQPQKQMLKLNDRLDSLTKKDAEYGKEDELEGAEVLPGRIFFQWGKNKLATTYDDNMVQMAPGKKRGRIGMIFPSLKAITGDVSIGRFNEQFFRNFEWFNEQGELIKHAPSVSDVIESAWHSVLGHFIVPLLADRKRNFNKMILTVPNSYTEQHKFRIRKVAEGVYQNLFKTENTQSEVKPPKVEFLSESDAVLWYYLKKQEQQGAVEGDRAQKETLLIYDMGAGTLDITLVEVEYEGARPAKISYKARLSKNTAGNYMDYMIAEAAIREGVELQDQVADAKGIKPITRWGRHVLQGIARLTDSTEITRITAFHGFIRNRLKPVILNWKDDYPRDFLENMKAGFKMNLNKASIQYVLSKFIAINTTDVVTQLKALAGENVIVTKVMFTGRATQLPGLKGDFIKAVKNQFNTQGDPEVVQVQLFEQEDASQLKSVVVRGALAYAGRMLRPESTKPITDDKGLYMKIGIMVERRGANGRITKAEYHAFLEPGMPTMVNGETDTQEPVGTTDVVFEQEKILALAQWNRIIIVQSYAAAPAEDWKERKEYSEEIRDISFGRIGLLEKQYENLRVKIQFRPGKGIKVAVEGQNIEMNVIANMHLGPETSFAKSLWPFISAEEVGV